MPSIRLIAAFALLGLCAAASAATSDYVLFEKIIKFKVPSDWNVIMEKKDGNPQFMAFQVRDPADPENNEISQVTINAKLMTTRRSSSSRSISPPTRRSSCRATNRSATASSRPCCATTP